jgi:hypothetical protein
VLGLAVRVAWAQNRRCRLQWSSSRLAGRRYKVSLELRIHHQLLDPVLLTPMPGKWKIKDKGSDGERVAGVRVPTSDPPYRVLVAAK